MPSKPFEDFCRRLCLALGVAPPVLEARGDAPAAFSLDHQGVAMVWCEAGPGAQQVPYVSLVVDFGEVHESEQAQVYPALLQANFLMLQACAPSFGLHPVTSRVTYHLCFDMNLVDPLAVCAALDGIAQAVMQWRETHGLAPPPWEGSGTPPPDPALRV